MSERNLEDQFVAQLGMQEYEYLPICQYRERCSSLFVWCEPVLFSFNYIHETQDDWKDIHYRICLGLTILDTFISDYSNDWRYIRSCLERIVNHSRTVIELNYEKEPTIALWIYCTRQIAIALEWDAAFKGMNDPSGRAVKGVHEQAY